MNQLGFVYNKCVFANPRAPQMEGQKAMSNPQPVTLTRPSRPRVAELVESLPPSGIREFFELVIGRDDIISLGVGEPDFVTPWRIREAAIWSLNHGETSYTSNWGLLSLRKEIARYLADRFKVEVDPASEVLITVGASEGIDLALRAVVNPGDEVIIPEPCYIAYEPLVRLAGGVPVAAHCPAHTGFQIDVDAIAGLITPRTRAILVNYPNNPTGATFTAEQVARLGRLAAEHEIIIISDEIYAELSYDFKHTSIASIPEAAEWTVVLSGFSKAFAMTGFRLGYAAGPRDILAAMTKIHQYNMLCAPITAQRAAETALREGLGEMADMVETYRQRRNMFIEGLREIGVPCHRPGGAFYMFPSIAHTGLTATDFCKRLLQEEKVAVVPGTAFGPSGEGHFRASYAASFQTIEAALKGIQSFINRL